MNEGAGVLDLFKKIMWNKGGLEKGINKETRKIATRESEKLIDASKKTAASIAGGNEKLAEGTLANLSGQLGNEYAAAGSAGGKAGTKYQENLLKNASSNSMITGENGISQEVFDANLKGMRGQARRGGAWNAAKDYYSEPFKAMGNAELSKDARKLATQQFVGRTGATAAGVGLAGSFIHDMASEDEDDVGMGGAIGNTALVGGLGAGAAFGASLLKKL